MSYEADRERLLRIISLCIDMEHRSVNPFELDVQELLTTLKKYLPQWQTLQDFILDAEALNRISSMVQLQEEWIKNRSTSLYIDPLLIEFKIKTIDTLRLVDLFISSWHPIIEFDGLSRRRVNEAIDYWNQLPLITERRMNFPIPIDNLTSVSSEELIKQKILSKTSFNSMLEGFWGELKKMVNDHSQISYWDFILADTYQETVHRAYLTSFLISYGYATLYINPLEEEVFLIPYEEKREISLTTNLFSVPIAIDYNRWRTLSGRANDLYTEDETGS